MSITGVGAVDSNTAALKARIESFKSGRSTITKDEVSKASEALGGKGPVKDLLDSFESIDTNGDGIDFTELLGYVSREIVPKLDADASGAAVTPLHRCGVGMPKELSQADLQLLRDGLDAGDTESASGFDSLLANFSSADTDGNGKLSPEEYAVYAQANGLPDFLSGVAGPHSGAHEDASNGVGKSVGSLSRGGLRKILNRKRSGTSEDENSDNQPAVDSGLSVSKFVESALRKYGGIGGVAAASVISVI